MTLALAVSACSVMARAQDAANTFEQLHARVKPGDMVVVTDTEGRDVRGRITVLSPSSLAVDVDWGFFTVAVGAGLGAGIGVGLDAWTTKEREIFRRRGSAAQVRLQPMPRARGGGLRVGIAF